MLFVKHSFGTQRCCIAVAPMYYKSENGHVTVLLHFNIAKCILFDFVFDEIVKYGQHPDTHK